MSTISGSPGVAQVMALRRQIVDQTQALRDLRQAGGPSGTGAAASPAQPQDGSFAGTLRNAVDEVSAAQRRSSDITAAYEQGQVTDVAQVMLARQEAGVAFEATLQVRNKLLSAYQDIMRMGV